MDLPEGKIETLYFKYLSAAALYSAQSAAEPETATGPKTSTSRQP